MNQNTLFKDGEKKEIEGGKKIEKIFMGKLNLQVPTRHAVLAIYEDMKTESEVRAIRNEVPSPMSSQVDKTRRELPRELDTTEKSFDWYTLSEVKESEDQKVMDMVMAHLCSSYAYECKDNLYGRKNWLQTLQLPSGATLLALFKCRIASSRSD